MPTTAREGKWICFRKLDHYVRMKEVWAALTQGAAPVILGWVTYHRPWKKYVFKAKTDDVLEIRLAEVLSDVVHDMGESAALQKDGVERDLQELLAAAPSALDHLCEWRR